MLDPLAVSVKDNFFDLDLRVPLPGFRSSLNLKGSRVSPLS